MQLWLVMNSIVEIESRAEQVDILRQQLAVSIKKANRQEQKLAAMSKNKTSRKRRNFFSFWLRKSRWDWRKKSTSNSSFIFLA